MKIKNFLKLKIGNKVKLTNGVKGIAIKSPLTLLVDGNTYNTINLIVNGENKTVTPEEIKCKLITKRKQFVIPNKSNNLNDMRNEYLNKETALKIFKIVMTFGSVIYVVGCLYLIKFGNYPLTTSD